MFLKEVFDEVFVAHAVQVGHTVAKERVEPGTVEEVQGVSCGKAGFSCIMP